MSDSDISNLCKKIYKNHRQALDLIFEHKPDVFIEIKDYLMNMVSRGSKERLILDHCSKSYIRFYINDWDNINGNLTGEGKWTKSNRVLLFEFQNYTDGVSLKLMIGPGEKDFRQSIFDLASENSDVFSGKSKSLYEKSTMIYKKVFISKKNLELWDLETITTTIEQKWLDFCLKDLIGMEKVIKEDILSD